MRKTNILLRVLTFILLLTSIEVFSLNYTINFTGSGATSTVGKVTVQNLTQGTSVTVPAGNSLILSDQPNAVEQLISYNETISVYPNGEDGKYMLSFYSKNSGSTQINAYSIDGRKITSLSTNLQSGKNTFELLLPKGIYTILVTGNGYVYTTKMINQNSTSAKREITYLGNDNQIVSAPQKSKSALTPVLMTYMVGDLLLYNGISGNFTTIITDIPVASKTINFVFVGCTDANANNYSIVKIGSQTWMAENLKTTKYRTGDDIVNLTNNSDWGMYTIGSWCNYNNDALSITNPGKLYNWYALSDSRNIAPLGWHVASDADWTMLTTYLGGEVVSGGKLKETTVNHWMSPNTSSTNEVGFTALPGGYRLTSGQYVNLGNNGNWWSLTENGTNYAWYRYMQNSSASVIRDYYNKNSGFSVRCVKDADLPTVTTSVPTSITYTTAVGGGSVTSDGGAPVTARGVCWSLTANPTILNSMSSNGTGSGTYSSSITGLNVNTPYYVRAFATNSTGTSYGNQVVFNSLPYDSLTVIDADGNLYHSITIGSQKWMVENLKTSKYRNGDVIGTTSSLNMDLTNAISPKYQWAYNGLESNASIYGRLYTWFVVTDPRNIAPLGWHVASDADWSILQTYLIANGYNYDKTTTDNKIAKSLCSTSYWSTSSSVGSPSCDFTQNNTSGLTMYPAGYRGFDGNFYLLGSGFDNWTSTEYSTSNAVIRFIGLIDVTLNTYNSNKNYGLSVRCIKNTTPSVSTNTPSALLSTTLTCGGNITGDGGETVTEYGLCWSTSITPTIANSKKAIGSGTGTFTSSISGLNPNTTYYLRAYATNSLGTAYGEQMSFKTLVSDPPTVIDADGNLYHSVIIGTQTWMLENLKTTKYRNGDVIGTSSSLNMDLTYAISPEYQWAYNGLESNVPTYGRLYTWYVVADTRNIAPSGWHVASDAEWSVLQNYLITNGYNYDKTTTDNKIAKSLCTSSLWISSTITGAPSCDLTQNNSSGFSMVPSGYRGTDGTFYILGSGTDIWTSTESTSSIACVRGCGYNAVSLGSTTLSKNYGFSVRCLQNSVPIVLTNSPSSISSTQATCGGSVTADGGVTITDYGICWSTSVAPTITDSIKHLGSGIGAFTSSISGLKPNMTYYLRAYATNTLGTSYGEQITFKTPASDPLTVVDVDGNLYHTVVIGTQTWMVENLKTTKYNDGAQIPLISDGYQWINLTTPGYCWASNDSNYNNLYGGMYNFYAVNTGKLAPIGWHVPTDNDWQTIINYLGGLTTSGSQLKETGTTHWASPNTDATNITGFTALPGGYRSITNGDFINKSIWGCWWSATIANGKASRAIVANYNSLLDYKADILNIGFSVRCIKD